jgi:predicted nucleic acid-binding protein
VLFADAVYWIAMTRRREQLRARSVQWKRWLDDYQGRLVTTEAIFWEWLNLLAAPVTRAQAAAGYRLCHADARVEVVPFAPARIQTAFELYQTRADKGWSLTDCLSFVVMRERRLTSALTSDHHFVQAGFRALLLEEPPS